MALLGFLQTAYSVFAYSTEVVLASLGFQATLLINNSASTAMQSTSTIEGEENMADYEGGLPIKTVRDNDAAFKLVDGQSGSTATKKLTVGQDGDAIVAGTNDFGIPLLAKDGTGDLVILPVPLPIDATDLDIRDLTQADEVTVFQGTDPWIVSATDLDIRDISHTTDSIKIGDGTDLLAVNADGSINAVVTATDLDIRDLTQADEVTVYQGTDPWVVSATDLDIRDIDATQDNIAISDGTDTLAVNTDGSINVVVTPTGTKVCDYKTTATVGVNSVANHDYTITNTKTIKSIMVLVGARGATKVRVGSYDGTTFVPKACFFQQIQGNHDHEFPGLELLGDGTLKVRIEITNLDGSSSDVYSSLNAVEV